ncbi:MAG: PilZ domain-containing protein [Desulfovibrionaceae bacterium]|nr:PilZ domain-containing protein [Desulfovibrionaceae bacterium]
MTQQQRIEDRISLVDIKVCLNTESGKILNCELLDVSPGGARLKLPPGGVRRKGGEKVTLQISSLPLGGLFNHKQALVIWADGQQLGMRLLDPLALPEEDMRKLLTFHAIDT